MYNSKYFYILKECSDKYRWKGASSGIIKIECKQNKSKVFLTIQNLNPSVLKYTLYLIAYNDSVFESKGIGQFLSGVGKQYFEFNANTLDCGKYNIAIITAETIEAGKRITEFCLAGGTSKDFVWTEDLAKRFMEMNKNDSVDPSMKENSIDNHRGVNTNHNMQARKQIVKNTESRTKNITDNITENKTKMSMEKMTDKQKSQDVQKNNTATEKNDIKATDIKNNNKPEENTVKGKNSNKDDILETFTIELNTYFDRVIPFEVNRNDYMWWKVTNLSNLNNILYKCRIGLPITMNPKVMISHFKNKHMLVGIYSDRRNNSRYIVFGIADTENGNGSGMPFDNICRWAATNEDRGYWLVYADTSTGELLS